MEVSHAQSPPSTTPAESGVSLSPNSPAKASNSTFQDSSLLVLASDLVVDADSFGFSGNTQCLDNNDSVESMADNDFKDLEELQVLRVEGCDRAGRRIVRIVGKFYPAPVVDSGRLKSYAHLKLLDELKEEPFVIVYFHTLVQRNENSPGILALRQIYEALPGEAKLKLQTIYFVHPGLRSRLLLATLGRYFLSEGLYWKINYVSRIEFLWDHIKKGEVEVPEFVHEHDNELESSPLLDYGLVIDPLQAYEATSSASSAHSRYANRFII